jgi:hypothetical protein
MTRVFGEWGDMSVFGFAQVLSVMVLSGLYILKWFRGGQNPSIEGNPFDTDNVLLYSRSAPQSLSVGGDWLGPIAGVQGVHGKAYTSCECEGGA